MQIKQTLIDKGAQFVMMMLEHHGHEARICGGAVRDILTDKTPKDWDIATTALPEQVVEIMEANDINVIPTGLQHGTVTAVVGGEPYEITTLRIDQETDGRHAVVEYTTDWELDSNRRDFTMNAMYIDIEGNVIDFHNGIDHLSTNRLEFVGHPVDRIQEDYLRILRFYRFLSRASNETVDNVSPDTKVAIQMYAEKLSEISGERIWAELKKTVMGIQKYRVVEMMYNSGVLAAIGMDGMMRRASSLREGYVVSEDPTMRVIGCFASEELPALYMLMKERFNASREATDAVKFIVENLDQRVEVPVVREMMAMGNSHYSVQAWAAYGGYRVGATNSGKMNPYKAPYETACNESVPDFPVKGELVMAMFPERDPGPWMGEAMAKMKKAWARSDYEMDVDQLTALLKDREVEKLNVDDF